MLSTLNLEGAHVTWGASRLLDMRDCTRPEWATINQTMKQLETRLQPAWFRPFVKLNAVSRRLGYDHWSRLWEYPWAVLSANLDGRLRILDIGSGGSAFPLYLAKQGHEVHSADPSLSDGTQWTDARKRMVHSLGIATAWGLPPRPQNGSVSVSYVPDSLQQLRYADGYFDRVFCLSVMEHVPETDWPHCMAEMSRVLSDRGRLVLTLDMSTPAANAQQFRKLLVEPSLTLVGEIEYSVPISLEDKQTRHPGHTYETVAIIWDKTTSNS
ncbi:MAG: class I SAM-dependent methyltransferase [Chloroflexi bacterium]|nr:class I SAM-dependent methyltransferase [Chloroflexota bacterium]